MFTRIPSNPSKVLPYLVIYRQFEFFRHNFEDKILIWIIHLYGNFFDYC